MSGKHKSDLSYDEKEKAEQNYIYAIIDSMNREDEAMNREEMASDMATADVVEALRNMTRDEWYAMEEAAANQLVGEAAAEAEEDPIIMKYIRQSAKEKRAKKAEETRKAARERAVMERRAEVTAASRRTAMNAMARAVRAADRMAADVVVGELSAREKRRLYELPAGDKWQPLKLESKDPGSSSRDPGSSSRDPGSSSRDARAMGRKLYKTRNKKSRRGRQGKRTRRARISRRARRTRRARK